LIGGGEKMTLNQYSAASKVYNQYKENSILTSTPEELTLMLYNGIVKFLMQAQAAIDENNVEKAHNSLMRAQDIIYELQSTLDMQYEISKQLSQLYDYMNRRIMEANIRKDKDILGEVLSFAKELRETWAQAMKIAKKQNRVKQEE